MKSAESSVAFVQQQAYDPDHLLDTLIKRLDLNSDVALSRALGVEPPLISKIRYRRHCVGASRLIRLHEVSALSIKELRRLMGDRREKFRISSSQFRSMDVASVMPMQIRLRLATLNPLE